MATNMTPYHAQFYAVMRIMFGFTFLCSGLMAATHWMTHGTKAILPIENGGELAVLYCFAFLFIAAQGAGIWSVDGARSVTKT